MEEIWYDSYPEGVAHEINPDKYNSIFELLDLSLKSYAEHNAFENFGTYITYEQLDLASQHFAVFLQNECKLKKGDKMSLMMPNVLQYPVALLACLRIGVVIVNTNPLYTERELKSQLLDSGAKAILVLESFAHVVECVHQETDVEHIIVTKMGDMLGSIKGGIINFIVKYIKRKAPAWNIKNYIKYSDALRKGESLKIKHVDITPDDIAFLQYTGGTTGVAKAAVLTQRNMISNVLQAKEWIQQYANPGKEVVLTALPLYHIFSLTANFFVFMLFGGVNILITNPRDTNAMIKHMAKFKFTALSAVNTLFNALNNNKNLSKVDFSNLKIALSGGMSLQESVARKWQEITGTVALEAYGLTETSPAVCINPINLKEYNGTVGLPISSTEVAIIDEDENELPIGELGELVIKGPQVMREYWNKPEETKNVFTKNGFLKTGDIAIINEGGFVKIVDRKKDMINISGFNVYPNEIEDVAMGFPGVKEVGVFGIANPKTGEAIKMVLVAEHNLIIDDLREYLSHNLTKYKMPKFIEIVDELPKSNVGKVLRKELREKYK